jgi:hypothetical protein
MFRPTDVRNPRHMPARSEVGDDTPLRLALAAILAYPDGSMTASGLRREAARGRLVIERTAGKDYTTLASIEKMRALCRVEGKAFAFDPRSGTRTARSESEQSGSSVTGRAKSARAALQKIARAPSARLASTSPTNTSQTVPAVVIPLKS